MDREIEITDLLNARDDDTSKTTAQSIGGNKGKLLKHKTRCFDETTAHPPQRHFLLCGHTVTIMNSNRLGACGGNCVASTNSRVTAEDREKLCEVPFACPCGHRYNKAFNYALANNAKEAQFNSRGRRCKCFVAHKENVSVY